MNNIRFYSKKLLVSLDLFKYTPTLYLKEEK